MGAKGRLERKADFLEDLGASVSYNHMGLYGLLQRYFTFYLYKEDVRKRSGPPMDSILFQIRNKCVSDSFYSPYEVFEKECFNVAFLAKRNPQSRKPNKILCND
jgi:hypothetical protein